MPHISGSDVAGVIEKVGAKVTNVKPGDRVVVNPTLSCGKCEYCKMGENPFCDEFKILGEHTDGGYAEFCKAPESNCMLIPQEFSFEEAAAAPLVFLTAWRMLVSRAKVKPGEDVLVLGAGGGVASAAIQIAKLSGARVAIQIAKLSGARVIATASTETKLEQAKKLGADILINYKTVEFDKEIWKLTNKRGVDVVVENIGEATWKQSIRSLARNGRLVTCGATTGHLGEIDIRMLFWKQLQIFGSTMSNKREFVEVMKLVWARKLKPIYSWSGPR
ncbi:zinc-binding dehydrogenase, partial [Candidatus Acetothermia bacterium]|nr:zinc-binding dehydrogenase [Candidatus Acetothermia bacterium]